MKNSSEQSRESKQRRTTIVLIALAHVLLVALVVLILLPGQKAVPEPTAFLVTILLIECFYLFRLIRKKTSPVAASWIVIFAWTALFIWELVTTQLNRVHPVLMPAPEAVFNVFPTQYEALINNTFASLELLFMGAVTAIIAGVILGAIAGWVKGLRDVFAPIARVLAPIPSVVFAPYLVALMPSFRSASAMVIFIGVFWPTFLNIIVRVTSIDRRIIESARMLELSSFDMVRKVILPYIIPSVVNGLNTQLTASIMMLTFAEMLGASAGLGYYIINYTYFANYTNVIAGIIVVGIVVTLLNWAINIIKRKTVRWR